MNSLIDALHSTLAWVIDLILLPFGNFPAITGLVFISAIAGVLFLLIFGKVSNQRALKKVKSEIYACILESVLFRHDLKLSLGAQARLFKNAGLYFCLAVPPVFVLLIPCLFLLGQLYTLYENRPLHQLEEALVTLEIRDPKQIYDVGLEAPVGLEVAGPVRIPESKEVVWRVKPTGSELPTRLEMKLSMKGDTYPVPLNYGEKFERLSPHIDSRWWWRFLYPALTAGKLTNENIASLSITYPAASYMVFGLNMHWLVIFFIVSLLAGIFASRFFKVEI